MSGGIVVEAGGFFTPQKKGGLSKLALLAHTDEEENALFALKHKRVMVVLAEEAPKPTWAPMSAAEIAGAIAAHAEEIQFLTEKLTDKLAETHVPTNPCEPLPFPEPLAEGDPKFTPLTKEDELPRCLRCGQDPCICPEGMSPRPPKRIVHGYPPARPGMATSDRDPEVCEWCGKKPCICEVVE